MSNTATNVIVFAAVFESLFIIVGNIFTIFVFWKHRNRLKRTYVFLINLAVADLLVGFTEPVALRTLDIPHQLEDPNVNSIRGNTLTAFQTTFSFVSVFFLVLISIERAYAMIWPLRHRVASTKGYIYGVTLAWAAGMLAGILTLLAVHDILDFAYWTVAYGCIMVLCLIMVCVSYLSIRTKLHRRDPTIDASDNSQNGPQQNAKFSRTLFVVTSASLVLWLPSIVIYCTHYLCSSCAPLLLFHVFNIFRLANSLVNPIIYCFRIPIFIETFKRMKVCKQSKRNEYQVNYTP